MTVSLSGEIKNQKHYFPVRIYYEDTDAQGIVYYANYLNYAERARTEMLRLLGWGHQETLKEGVGFVVRHCEVDYKKSAQIDDILTLETFITKMGASSLYLTQNILKQDEILVTVKVCLVFIDVQTYRPKRIDELWRKKIMSLIEK